MLEEPRLKAPKPFEWSVPVDNVNPIHLLNLYIVKGLFHKANIDTPLTLWNDHKRYPLAHGPWVHHTRLILAFKLGVLK